MSKQRLTYEEMIRKFPNKWLFIVDCEISPKTTELISGVVFANKKHRRDIDNISSKYKGKAAIRFTGEIPKDRMYLL